MCRRSSLISAKHASRRFLEFFIATITNVDTRSAYHRAVLRFFGWCDQHHIGGLVDTEPLHVTTYIETLKQAYEKPTIKQYLAAIRMLFDWLVIGGILTMNPATSMRGPKHVVKRVKTPVLAGDQTRALLDSIDVATLFGLRDRVLNADAITLDEVERIVI